MFILPIIFLTVLECFNESLESLDGEESLTGDNGDLSPGTLEPDRPWGNHPSSRPVSNTAHLLQSDAQNNPCGRPSYHNMTSDMESELGIDGYAAALRDNPLSWILEGNPDDSEGETQEIGSSNTLKVVHFGLV